MNYEKQLDAFYASLIFKPLSSNANAMYGFILHVCRTAGWPSSVSIANSTLQGSLGLTLKQLQTARNELITNNLIDYKKGGNQNKAPRYSTPRLYEDEKNTEVTAEGIAQGRAEGMAEGTAQGTAQGYIITILDLFFNYINKGDFSKFFKNILPTQADGIRNCLRKWEFLVSENAMHLMNEKTVFRYQVLYWCIKEMYFSPYKELLNSLTKEEINNKYLKTEKYVGPPGEENIVKFINYFIVCLREKLDK